ncbi:tRNA-dihydrouridine synthase family protein [Cobetia sp.]|jgi:tRNA-dihydrouridine synthase C|uniref:tRNA dihydrouridine synthase n=2 Tax=Cobetia TaxID=204286 RepID=UPI00257EC334|nr:tRNA-dihydrouridine synthase family protein [Cobetia sp.]|tara:strand:- start:151789 stop:152907 length:1119 start_codon:yes stop_codon:yes gene_type:complete
MTPSLTPQALARAGRIGIAPMEGVIDDITRECLTGLGGYDWCVTEFVRVTHVKLPPRVFKRICPELLDASPTQTAQTRHETPVALQLLGADPEALGINARVAARLGAPSVDINFGCPAKTVNRHDGGAALLRSPERVFRAVEGVRKALEGTGVPVTAKIRLGFNDRRLALACAQAAEAGGATQLVVHGRTKQEGYRPPAHWEWIGKITSELSIPVVANGDIWDMHCYWRARSLSGCRDVMLGRAALADPFLAARIKHWQATGELLPETDWTQRAQVLLSHAERCAHLPDKVMVPLLKQWMNMMRQSGNAEAESRFQAIKRHKGRAEFFTGLVAGTALELAPSLLTSVTRMPEPTQTSGSPQASETEAATTPA